MHAFVSLATETLLLTYQIGSKFIHRSRNQSCFRIYSHCLQKRDLQRPAHSKKKTKHRWVTPPLIKNNSRVFMHPRNRFKDHKPDFGAYAQARKSLEPCLVKRKNHTAEGFHYTIDFSDPNSLRELTCACLKKEFDLDVIIPSDRLVPTIPQRLNYVHWIEDLVSDGKGNFPKGPNVIGIDIGNVLGVCVCVLLYCKSCDICVGRYWFNLRVSTPSC